MQLDAADCMYTPTLDCLCVRHCDVANAGVQLAKMTPCRSFVVIMGSCVAAVFGKAVGFESFPVYVSVRPRLKPKSA